MGSSPLAVSRKALLQRAADLRSPRQVSKQIFSDVAPHRVCPAESQLAQLLTENEQKFWHAFLANADVFASIAANTGEKFDGQTIGMGWADICFATAEVIFDMLTGQKRYSDTAVPETLLYANNRLDSGGWEKMRSTLYDKSRILLFEMDSTAEGHKFIVYPVGRDQVLLAQSVGGIMRATLRIFSVVEFQDLLLSALRSVSAVKKLFGYAIANNRVQRLAVEIGVRRADVGPHVLLGAIERLSAADRKRMHDTFAQHYDWDDFDPQAEVDDYFDMDSSVSQQPFYFVHPLSFEWQCVSRAVDVPQSEVAIALQSGAVCPVKAQ